MRSRAFSEKNNAPHERARARDASAAAAPGTKIYALKRDDVGTTDTTTRVRRRAGTAGATMSLKSGSV
jgi:hypothetical protein